MKEIPNEFGEPLQKELAEFFKGPQSFEFQKLLATYQEEIKRFENKIPGNQLIVKEMRLKDGSFIDNPLTTMDLSREEV